VPASRQLSDRVVNGTVRGERIVSRRLSIINNRPLRIGAKGLWP
jgi:hypothetical protein